MSHWRIIGLVWAVLLGIADLVMIPHSEDPRTNMLRLLCVCTQYSRDNWAPILVSMIIPSFPGIWRQCGRISDSIIGCFFYKLLQSLTFTFLLVELESMQVILPMRIFRVLSRLASHQTLIWCRCSEYVPSTAVEGWFDCGASGRRKKGPRRGLSRQTGKNNLAAGKL